MARREDGSEPIDLAALATMSWRALFDAIPHPTVIMAPDRVVVAANDAVTERLGCDEGELLGKRCWEIFHSPDHQGPTSRCLMDPAVTGSASRQQTAGEIELEQLGGYFRVSCVALFDPDDQVSHVVHMATDVSDRRRSELAALESERLFRTLFDQAGDYILLVDPAHPNGPTIIDANQSACEKHGYTRDELLGMAMIELDAPESRKLVPEMAGRLMAGEDLVFETVHLRKDGSRFPVEVSAKLLQIGGQPRIFAIERDITERKQAEQDRERLQAQLLQAQKLESLGVLTGGIAHDFNNLLMGMLGNADLLLRNLPIGDPMRRRVEGINTAARRAKDLVRQMLAYAGGERFEVTSLDVHGLVEEMVGLLEAALPKSVTLELCKSARVPAVEADASQIRQVVMNVITNASEAMGDQGGRICIRVGAQDYDAASLEQTYLAEELPAGTYVFVEVADEGVGMDQHTLERIFDPFFTTKFEGRGLGLAAVLGIVRGHRGALAITSKPGEGTTFTVLLPASEGVASRRDQADDLEPWGRGRRVLVVDDEEGVRRVAQSMLRWLGFEVAVAPNGERAREAFAAHPERFDVVLLDATMPGMGGRRCLDALLSSRADVPVLVMSGHAPAEIRRQFVGARGVLPKPFDLGSLSQYLRRALDEE